MSARSSLHLFRGDTSNKLRKKAKKLLWLDSTGAPVPGVVVVGGGPALNGAPQRTNGGANAGGNLSVERDLFTAIEKFTYFGRACHPLES